MRRRPSSLASIPTDAKSVPSKRAKHFDVYSASAEARSERILAPFWEDLQFSEPVSRVCLFDNSKASASPLKRARIASIDRIVSAIKGVRAKIPRLPRLRAKRDEIFAQAKISTARGGVGQSTPGIFTPTPIFQPGKPLANQTRNFGRVGD